MYNHNHNRIDVPIDKKEETLRVSLKEFKLSVLPPVGTEIDLDGIKFVVMALNTGKFRFSAETSEMPRMDSIFVWEGKKYHINYLMPEKKRFSATFIGFLENVVEKVPDAPPENNEVVKVLE